MTAAATPFHTKNKILAFQDRPMTCSDRRKQSDLTDLSTPHTVFFRTAYPEWIGLCAESESDASGWSRWTRTLSFVHLVLCFRGRGGKQGWELIEFYNPGGVLIKEEKKKELGDIPRRTKRNKNHLQLMPFPAKKKKTIEKRKQKKGKRWKTRGNIIEISRPVSCYILSATETDQGGKK